jgi:putative ABC transport system permease protein
MKLLSYTCKTLLRGRGSNVIRLVSLTFGLLFGILIFTQIAYEFSFETCYKEPEKVVMLQNRYLQNGKYSLDKTCNRPAAAALSEALPELIECGSASTQAYPPTLFLDDKKLEQMEVIYADTLYFKTIGLPVLKGDPQELAAPGVAFLSESKARELFGSEDPIGKELSMDKTRPLRIKGIYQDIPGNTWFQGNIIISLATFEYLTGGGGWQNNDIYTILFRLHKSSDIEALNNVVQQTIERFIQTKYDGWEANYFVQSILELHTSNPDTERKLVILFVLGFAIFFVSIMNYVLAAVASLGRRAKGIGVNKCLGAGHGHILSMFMSETAVLVFFSIIAALVLMVTFRESIETMLESKFVDIFSLRNLYAPIAAILLLFIVAGVLPGEMFARIPVTRVFRRYTDSKSSWKRGLLFVQFIGVAFILGMLATTIEQYNSLMHRDIGFRSEGLAVGSVRDGTTQSIANTIKNEPYVEAVSSSGSPLYGGYSTRPIYNTQGKLLATCHYQTMAKNLPEVVGMRLLAGRLPQHNGEVLVGKKMLEVMSWSKEEALGERVPGWYAEDFKYMGLEVVPTIVGVIDDIRNTGFYDEQRCTAFILNDPSRFNYNLQIRLKEPEDENFLRLSRFINETFPNTSVRLYTYNEMRRTDNDDVYQFRNTVLATSLCIVLIVLMGLIGYVNDETERRSKEIAIRKVNGAEAPDILRLLAIDILKVAVVAVLIGIGSAYYLSGVWMEQFPDGTKLSPLWFAAIALLVMVLIVACVVIRAWHIANENPAKSIKSE